MPGGTPVPLSDAVDMPPGLALAVSVAMRAPSMAGAKRTVTEHPGPGETTPPHVLDSTVNSDDPVEKLGMPVETPPVFVTPNTAVPDPLVATLPKFCVIGDSAS